MAFTQQVSPSGPPRTHTAEYCLRYPENLGVHQTLPYEHAMSMLLNGAGHAQRVPFAWSYIDKPPDGQVYLLFMVPSAPSPMPPDGIRWLEPEQTFRLHGKGGQELEVSEAKLGFVPGAETNAARVRRRFRLTKGGNAQLMLVHYSRAPPGVPVPAQIANAPVRVYPIRAPQEPHVYVTGERVGQKVHPSGGMAGAAAGGGMGVGIGPMGQVAQQSQAMEAMERERRTRMAAGARPGEDEDSGDENETITARTLAIERFRRNHELMAEVFSYASQGRRGPPSHPSPYASLDLAELDEKVAKLSAEVDELSAKADERRRIKEEEEQADERVPVEVPAAA